MALLTAEERDSLTIERMIFHVVRPDLTDPLFMAEVTPITQALFFLERIKETLAGSAYVFAPGAGIPALLRRAIPAGGSAGEFVQVSRDLASRFKVKVKQDRRHAAGVLMLFLLKTGDKYIFAVIKYEHKKVISYGQKKDNNGNLLFDKDGNPVPDLQSIINTFTEDKSSMQKSAVIRLAPAPTDGAASADQEATEPEGRLVVIDRSSKRYRDATEHFSDFLDIKREMEPAEMAQRLEDAAVEAIVAHKNEVPPEVGKAPKRAVREAMARMDGFDHEKIEEFLGSIVQGLAADAPVLETFRRHLSARGLATEAFELRGLVRPPPENRRVVTEEGMALFFKKVHEQNGKVKIDPKPGGGVTITVQSNGLVWNDEAVVAPRLPT